MAPNWIYLRHNPLKTYEILICLYMYRLVHAYNPKILQSPISTPVLMDSPWKICTHVYFAPAEQVTNALFCYISPDIRDFFYCWGYLGVEGTHISGEKNEKNQCVKGSTGAHRTSAHNFRVSLSKMVWTFGRLCSWVQKSRLRFVITCI